MIVGGKNGKHYEVDVEQLTCSCSSFIERKKCNHLFLAVDVFKRKAQTYHYQLKQAFTCEIRRSSSDAINWGRAICKAKGSDYFLRLCRHLIRTETRNLAALEASYQSTDPGHVLKILFESAKLHENPYYIGAHQAFIAGFYKYQSIHYKNYQSPVVMLREFIDQVHDIESAYVVLFFVEHNREILNSFIRMLYDKAVDDRNFELIRYLELGEMNSPESWRFACELMVRYWSNEAELSIHTYAAPEFMIPSFKNYQRPMKELRAVFEKHHGKIRPNKKLPSDLRVDLRYSDSFFGFFWRMLAMNQKGTIEDLAWEDVEFSVNDWLSAQILDKRYFPTLYHDILLAG